MLSSRPSRLAVRAKQGRSSCTKLNARSRACRCSRSRAGSSRARDEVGPCCVLVCSVSAFADERVVGVEQSIQSLRTQLVQLASGRSQLLSSNNTPPAAEQCVRVRAVMCSMLSHSRRRLSAEEQAWLWMRARRQRSPSLCKYASFASETDRTGRGAIPWTLTEL